MWGECVVCRLVSVLECEVSVVCVGECVGM